MNKILLSTILSTTVLLADVVTTDVAGKYTSKTSPVSATTAPVQSIDLGFANTSGNTKTLNLNAKYTFSHMIESENYEPFKYNFQATGFLNKDDGTKTAEEYTALLNGEQDLQNNWLAYIALGWLRNEFKNYDNKFSLAIGIGKTLFDDGKQKLVVKVGPAYNIEEYSNGQATEKFGSINEYLEYTNKLNQFSDLYLKVGAMENFDDLEEDYETTALLGVNFVLSENLHLTIEEELNYDNLPPVGFDKTDTKSIVRLGYKF